MTALQSCGHGHLHSTAVEDGDGTGTHGWGLLGMAVPRIAHKPDVA